MTPSDNTEATVDHGPTSFDDYGLFNHRLHSRVRSYDVDRQNIVHNAVYLYWLEAARIEYFRDIGVPIDRQSFVTKHRFVVVRAEVDYIYAAQFDDAYTVFTKVCWVKNSSFAFEHVVAREDGKILATAKGVLVHLNPATNEPSRIPDSYRTLIKEFEGSNTEFVD